MAQHEAWQVAGSAAELSNDGIASGQASEERQSSRPRLRLQRENFCAIRKCASPSYATVHVLPVSIE